MYCLGLQKKNEDITFILCRCENKTPLFGALENVAISMSHMTADDKSSLFLRKRNPF